MCALLRSRRDYLTYMFFVTYIQGAVYRSEVSHSLGFYLSCCTAKLSVHVLVRQFCVGAFHRQWFLHWGKILSIHGKTTWTTGPSGLWSNPHSTHFMAAVNGISIKIYICLLKSSMAKLTTITNKAIRDGKYLARHMPVLIFFSWRHFSARSSCYIINWYGYPRGSHEKYLKEIVSPVFEIRCWIVTC